MAFDLARALAKKAEVETARLVDFEFRRRARATRLLADAYGLDPGLLVTSIARSDEATVIEQVAETAGFDRAAVAATYDRAVAEAHATLVAERGDPSPYRLA